MAGAEHLRFLQAALGFSHIPAVSIGRLLVVGGAFHLPQNALTLTHFFESSHELLDRFARTWFNFDHAVSDLLSCKEAV